MRRWRGILSLGAALGAWAATRCQPERTEFKDSLQPIPRKGGLSTEEFWLQHVLPGIPVIIETDDGEGSNLPAWNETAVVELCGDRRLSALSTAASSTVDTIKARSPGMYTFLSLLLWVITGQGCDEWMQQRLDFTLREFSQRRARKSRHGIAGGHDIDHTDGSVCVPAWVWWVTRTSDKAAELLEMLRVMLGPPYIADTPVSRLCPELEQEMATGGLGTVAQMYRAVQPYTTRTFLQEKLGELRGTPLSDAEKAQTDPHDGPHLFWGDSGSSIYPLHRDHPYSDVGWGAGIDTDNMQHILTGCKEIVLLHNASEAVKRSRVVGTQMFRLNLFDAPAPTSAWPGQSAWYGVARAGELVYWPGSALHHVRVACDDTLTVNMRPWKHSVAQELAMRMGVHQAADALFAEDSGEGTKH